MACGILARNIKMEQTTYNNFVCRMYDRLVHNYFQAESRIIYYIYCTRTGCLPEQINSQARSFQTYFSNLLIKTPWSSFIEINFINRERLSCPFRTWFKTCFPIQGYGKYKSDCAAPLYSWERLFTSVRAVECTLNGDWDALGASIDFLSLSKGICDVMIETRNQVISLFGCNLFFNFLNYQMLV